MGRRGTAQAVASLEAAFAGELQPPDTVKLRPGDLPIWSLIMRARARSEWTELDLHHAANLARCLADIERIGAELATEGDTLHNGRGTVVVNPKHAVLETLSRRSVSLSRLLQIHALAVGVKSEKRIPGRQEEAAARELVDTLGDDDLLARPHHVQ